MFYRENSVMTQVELSDTAKGRVTGMVELRQIVNELIDQQLNCLLYTSAVYKRQVPDNEVLEELFQMFNLSRPQAFEGHSLSVSDVIALKRNGKVSVHYVDSIGFKELPGFLDKKPEHSSVLQMLKEKCDAPECNPTGCRKARAEHEL